MRATVDEATNWTGLTALVPFTVSADTLTYLPNSKIASGDTPTFEGATGDIATVEKSGYDWPDHRFVGWNTKPDGTGDAYAPGGEYRLGPGEDVLYAQWDPVGELACGRCDACLLRLRGFQEAGVKDPVQYAG